MSLCSRCGHNSVFHLGPDHGGCKGHLHAAGADLTIERIWREKAECNCTLERWDQEFREGQDEQGNLREGWPLAGRDPEPEPPVCPWCGRRMSACQCEDDEVGF